MMDEIVVTVYGERTAIYDPDESNCECESCRLEVPTIELREVHTFNPVHVCLDCLQAAIDKSRRRDAT